jgi:hypothetical protein
VSTADGVVLGMTQIFGTAPRGQAFNVVLLADGFTSASRRLQQACAAFVTRSPPRRPSVRSHAISVFRSASRPATPN